MELGSVVEAVSEDVGGASLDNIQSFESLCMHCGQNGTTNSFITFIPHFRKIWLSAFDCPHCGDKNNEVMFVGEIPTRCCCYTLVIPSGNPELLNRQVVKSEYAIIKIPELDFEIQSKTRCGSLSTIEGILMRAADELQALQEERRKVAPETAEAIDQFLVKLRACATGELSFTFILDDPAGNSFIENPFAPSSDPSLTIKFYDRTDEKQALLGYQVREEPHGSVGAAAGHRAIAQSNSAEIAEALLRYTAPEEVDIFPIICACGSSCETRVFKINIPYFQEAILFASTCDGCGYRSFELKAGGGIPEKGKKITLHVKNINDLSRDVIKSDTSSIEVPELDFEKLPSGTSGGAVTTIEGLVKNISESLEKLHGFTFGDSLEEDRRSKWLDFGDRLNKLLTLEKPWTLILDDPEGNSFIAPATDDLKDDKQLIYEEYERTWEQDEELGLHQMDTSSADAAYESANPSNLE
ncbi:uncharacterized protein [Cicer arietinum]|uniref:Zinc finger protein ZPR1-like n=1 Tax=Cicer arietinum TaxID=3827 RepID=A0A1S2YM13_CICAR|nr:zinc finger protein ZPR1-like [Cicer arietinum]